MIVHKVFYPAKVMPFLEKRKKLFLNACHPCAGKRDSMGSMHSKTLIPEIQEIHYATEQLAIPWLFQLKVDILGATAKNMKLVE